MLKRKGLCRATFIAGIRRCIDLLMFLRGGKPDVRLQGGPFGSWEWKKIPLLTTVWKMELIPWLERPEWC